MYLKLLSIVHCRTCYTYGSNLDFLDLLSWNLYQNLIYSPKKNVLIIYIVELSQGLGRVYVICLNKNMKTPRDVSE